MKMFQLFLCDMIQLLYVPRKLRVFDEVQRTGRRFPLQMAMIHQQLIQVRENLWKPLIGN